MQKNEICNVYIHFLFPAGSAGLIDLPEHRFADGEPNVALGTVYTRVDEEGESTEFRVFAAKTRQVGDKRELHLWTAQEGTWKMFRRQ